MPANKGTPPEMITTREAASRMGSSAALIEEQLRLGTFPIGWAFNTGKQWRYFIVRAEFEAMMAGEMPTNKRQIVRAILSELAEDMHRNPDKYAGVVVDGKEAAS